MFQTVASADRRDESTPERMGELLRARISTESVPGDQCVRRGAPDLPSETTQPATLSTAEGEDVLRALSTIGVSAFVETIAQLPVNVCDDDSRKAGCGKSASPV